MPTLPEPMFSDTLPHGSVQPATGNGLRFLNAAERSECAVSVVRPTRGNPACVTSAAPPIQNEKRAFHERSIALRPSETAKDATEQQNRPV